MKRASKLTSSRAVSQRLGVRPVFVAAGERSLTTANTWPNMNPPFPWNTFLTGDPVRDEAAVAGKESLAILVAIDNQTDEVFISIAAPTRGPNPNAVRRIDCSLISWGCFSMTLHPDGESSIVAVKKATVKS